MRYAPTIAEYLDRLMENVELERAACLWERFAQGGNRSHTDCAQNGPQNTKIAFTAHEELLVMLMVAGASVGYA